MWLDDPGCPTDSEVRTILEAAVELLRTDGAAIDIDSRPVDFEESMRVFFPLISSAISPGLSDDLLDLARTVDAIPESPGEDLLLALGRGTMMRHREWIKVDERRERLRRQWAAWFVDHDALLCPVGPVAAQPLSDKDLMSRTMIVNGSERPANDLISWPGLMGVAYLPSTVVPVGRTSSGPPSVSNRGPYLGDFTALRVAERLEALTGGICPRPWLIPRGDRRLDGTSDARSSCHTGLTI